MGLPLPGDHGVEHHSADGGSPEAGLPSNSAHVSNMWNWKPADSASEGADAELAAVEQSEQVTKAPAPEEAPVEPKEEAPVEPKEEAPKPAAVEEALPEVAPVEAAVEEAPKPEAAPAEAPKESSNPLASFLGASAPATKTVVPEAPVAKVAKAPESSVLSSYMADL